MDDHIITADFEQEAGFATKEEAIEVDITVI